MGLQNFPLILYLFRRMKSNQKEIEKILVSNGFANFKWIDPDEIVVSQWVRFKCMFGCSSYNTRASCPPNVPTVEDCARFFKEYDQALIIHISKKLDDPNDRDRWSNEINKELLRIEREVFLLGNRKAFILFMDECRLCDECSVSGSDCKNKKDSRPGPESLAVDVFQTVKKYDFPIKVLNNYDEEMNRYSILLVE